MEPTKSHNVPLWLLNQLAFDDMSESEKIYMMRENPQNHLDDNNVILYLIIYDWFAYNEKTRGTKTEDKAVRTSCSSPKPSQVFIKTYIIQA